MGWRTHKHKPGKVPDTFLIAVRDDTDGKPYLLNELYCWDGVDFVSEDHNRILPHAEFCWLPESEILAGLPW